MKTWKKPTVKTISAEELEKIIITSACSNHVKGCINWMTAIVGDENF
jgi:hypothetical protein